MKILYITKEINRHNGWGVISYYTIKNAMENGHSAEVLVDKDSVNEYIEGVRYLKLITSRSDGYLKLFRLIKDTLCVNRVLNIQDFDVIHILVEPLLPVVNFLTHKKVIFGIAGTYSVFPFQLGFNKWLYQRALKKVDRIISISDYTSKKFEVNNAYNIPVHTIPLGVDNDLYGSQEKTENKSKEEAFCFVGEIKPRKGLLYAIKATEKLKDTCPNIRLYVLGKEQFGEYSNACRNYVSEKNLKDNVIFIGYIPNDKKKQYYHRCIANVLPSVNENNYFEGFGLIHLEANAAGIPSIGSKNCGNESAIKDGVNGFLCEQKDVDSLYDRMRYILSLRDKEEYFALCERCKEYAQKNDWKNYIPKVLEIYRD